MRIAVFIVTVCALGGCTSQPAPRPVPPPPTPPPALCVVPSGMTETAARPPKPVGDYTQRDVALFLEALDAWGEAGWIRVLSIRSWSDDCDRRARSRTLD